MPTPRVPENWREEIGDVEIICPAGSDTDKLDYSNAHAINVGVNWAIEKQKPDVILYANDDVVFSVASISALAKLVHQNPHLIAMPVGNDQQGRYHMPMKHVGPYRLDYLRDNFERMVDVLAFGESVWFYDTLCTYALAITPVTWHAIGGMDERFAKAGPDDIDFCLRAKAKGYQPCVYTASFVWHACGTSADITHTPESRAANAKLFAEKWGAG